MIHIGSNNAVIVFIRNLLRAGCKQQNKNRCHSLRDSEKRKIHSSTPGVIWPKGYGRSKQKRVTRQRRGSLRMKGFDAGAVEIHRHGIRAAPWETLRMQKTPTH